MRMVRGHDPLRAEGAHVQPHRRGARAAVVEKSDRPVARLLAILEVGHIEHRCLGRLLRRAMSVPRPPVRRIPAARLGSRIVPALGMHDQESCDRVVADRVAFDGHGAGRRARQRVEVRIAHGVMGVVRAMPLVGGSRVVRAGAHGSGVRLHGVAGGLTLGGLRGAALHQREDRRGNCRGKALHDESAAYWVAHDHSPAWWSVLRMKAATLSWSCFNEASLA